MTSIISTILHDIATYIEANELSTLPDPPPILTLLPPLIPEPEPEPEIVAPERPKLRRCASYIPFSNNHCPVRFRPHNRNNIYCSYRCASRHYQRRRKQNSKYAA